MSLDGKTQMRKNYVSLIVCDELYALIAKEADKKGIAMSDVAVKSVAEHFNRLDLGYVPRVRPGRKRFKKPA